MNKKPFFSIIIPALNEEHQLPILLRSLLRQSFGDFEVIVSEAGSEDKTYEIANSFIPQFTKKGIRMVVCTKKVRNVAATRNLGASRAAGTFLVFCDADVKIPNRFLTDLHKKLSASKTDACTVWTLSDTNKTKDKMIAVLMNMLEEASLIAKKPFIIGHLIIIKHSVFEAIGRFDESFEIVEDYELTKRLYDKKFKLKIFKKPNITVSMRRYRKHGHARMLATYASIIAHIILHDSEGKKALKSLKVDYPMGGHAHK